MIGLGLSLSLGVGKTGGTPPSGFAVSGALDDGAWLTSYSDSLTASGGTAPYSVSGLPAGLVANISGGNITITGAPV